MLRHIVGATKQLDRWTNNYETGRPEEKLPAKPQGLGTPALDGAQKNCCEDQQKGQLDCNLKHVD